MWTPRRTPVALLLLLLMLLPAKNEDDPATVLQASELCLVANRRRVGRSEFMVGLMFAWKD